VPARPPDPARVALEAALLSHRAEDGDEESDLVRMLSLVRREPECFARTTFSPGHFVGSAFICCTQTRKVLLHRHRRLGRWLQMGGHDEGERDLYRTALREGVEESGLPDLAPLSPLLLDVTVHPIPAGKGEPPHLHFDVRWVFATERPGAVVRDDAESEALEWLDLDAAALRRVEPAASRALGKIARLL
jgi:8-oxo-dGTP pyrophosphatase MutT (NUDIX family)